MASEPYQPAGAGEPAGKRRAAVGWDDLTDVQRVRLAGLSAAPDPVDQDNGRKLADLLRRLSPEPDMSIAHLLLILLDEAAFYEEACELDQAAAWALWWAAAEMAAVELTFFERM
jgi:hypothetical protein